jgi:multiple sugar transport system permease protein
MNRSTKKKVVGVIRFFVLAFYLLLVVLPIYWMIVTSFKTNAEIVNAQVITYWPKTFTLDNYKGLFSVMNYGTYLKNSLIVTLSTSLVVTVLSIYGGYGLARFKFRGKGVAMVFFLVTQMIPSILVIIPLYVVFSQMHLIDTYTSLFIFYTVTNLPFCAITMRSFFERIPYALEEAAFVDGCSRGQTLWKVVLPVMFPGIVAVFVFAFIGAWNELIAGTIFLNTQKMWTIPIGLKSLVGKYNVDWGSMMAGGCLALLPTALMFIFVQKYIVEGMTAGAVKG